MKKLNPRWKELGFFMIIFTARNKNMAHLDHHMEFSVKFLSRSHQKLPNETDFYELITLNPNFYVLNVLQITIFTSVEVSIWPENKLRIRKFILFCEKFHTKRRPFWLKTIFLNQKSEMGKFSLKFEGLDASFSVIFVRISVSFSMI